MMIYCNKRKKKIKPEVGQIWGAEDGAERVRIVAITDHKHHPIIAENPEMWFKDINRYSKSGNLCAQYKIRRDLYELIKESPKPKSPWQPIESAPKDGTDILVLFKNKRVSNAFWSKANKTFCRDELNGFGQGELTHWRPLPDAPEVE